MNIPHSRLRLTSSDIDFVAKQLGMSEKAQGFIMDTLVEGASDDIIDNLLTRDQVWDALNSGNDIHKVSAYLFFYVDMRRFLSMPYLDEKENIELADYVAGVLGEFTRQERLTRLSPSLEHQET